MDPAVLYASTDRVAAKARRMVREYGPHPGHVFNLGHGIHPGIDSGKVAAMVDAVHRSSGEILSDR